jgi:hypothetical protein
LLAFERFQRGVPRRGFEPRYLAAPDPKSEVNDCFSSTYEFGIKIGIMFSGFSHFLYSSYVSQTAGLVRVVLRGAKVANLPEYGRHSDACRHFGLFRREAEVGLNC